MPINYVNLVIVFSCFETFMALGSKIDIPRSSKSLFSIEVTLFFIPPTYKSMFLLQETVKYNTLENKNTFSLFPVTEVLFSMCMLLTMRETCSHS